MISEYRFITTYRKVIRVVASGPDRERLMHANPQQASQSVNKTLFLLQDAGVARTVSQLPRFVISFRLSATVFL